MPDLIPLSLARDVAAYAERHGLGPLEALAYLIEAGLTAEAGAPAAQEAHWASHSA